MKRLPKTVGVAVPLTEKILRTLEKKHEKKANTKLTDKDVHAPPNNTEVPPDVASHKSAAFSMSGTETLSFSDMFSRHSGSTNSGRLSSAGKSSSSDKLKSAPPSESASASSSTTILQIGSHLIPDAHCAYCSRSRRWTPNPCPTKHPNSATLTWRRREGCQCSSCPWVVHENWPTSDPKVIMDRCENEKGFRENEFTPALVEWEERYEAGENRKNMKRKNAAVFAEEQAGLKTEEMHGVLWPANVYLREMGTEAKRTELVTIRHRGSSLRGVLRDPKFGTPIGSVVCKGEGFVGVKRQRTLADSEEVHRQEVIDEIYVDGCNKLALKNATNKEGVNVLTPARIGGSKKKEEIPEGFQTLDDIWVVVSGFKMPSRGGKHPRPLFRNQRLLISF